MKNIELVSKQLNVNPNTIRKWEKDFNLEIKRNSKNNRIFDDEVINVLESIKNLKEDGNGTETITRKLSLDSPELEVPNVDNKSNTENNNQQPEPKVNVTYMEPESTIIQNELKGLSSKLDGIMELAEKYSRATYEIGSLKAQLDSKERETRLLTDWNNKEVVDLKNEINSIHNVLDGKNKIIDEQEHTLEEIQLKHNSELEALKEELEKERSKSWWKKLLGK